MPSPSSSRAPLPARVIGVLLVGLLFLLFGLATKQNQLYEQCGPLPGLGTTLGWLLALGAALVIVLVGAIAAALGRSRRILSTAVLIAAAAPVSFGLGLLAGPHGADPCGFNEAPQSLLGRAELHVDIETEPFAGESDERGECQISAATGHASSLQGMPDQGAATWTIAGWDVELHVLGLAEEVVDQDLMVAFTGAGRAAWYGSPGQQGWRLEMERDGSGRITFDALPLVPGAEWDAPEEIVGSISWTCIPGDPN